MRAQTVSIFVLSLILTSCFSGSDDSPPEGKITELTFGDTPRLMTKAQEKCLDDNEQRVFSAIFWDMPSLRTKNLTTAFETPFRGERTFRDSEKSIISETTQNQKEIITYIFNEDIELEETPQATRRKGQLLDVCLNENIPKDSLENMTVTAAYAIEKAFTKSAPIIKELFDITVKPIKLHAQYLYERNIVIRFDNGDEEKQKEYVTDNAAYSDGEIFLYPQSEESITDGDIWEMPLWQVPFVPAHEFGHHLFRTLIGKTGKYFPGSKLTDSDRLRIHRIHSHERFARETMDKMEDHEKIVRAFNEGFADLVAVYSLSKNESDLSTMECFRRNREVTSPNFGDFKTKKAIDYTAYYRFFYDTKSGDKGRKSCNDPNTSTIHHIGAMHAYVFNQLLEAKFGAGLETEQEAKLKTILTWVKKLAPILDEAKSLSVEKFYMKTIDAFIESLTGQVKVEDEKLLEVLRKDFSKYYYDREEK